jgi:YD repeat-containing protein
MGMYTFLAVVGVLVALTAHEGLAQVSSETQYDSRGHVIQQSFTNGNNTSTFRPDGSLVGRTVKEGNTSTTYDRQGHVAHRSVTQGNTTTTHDSTGKRISTTIAR